MLNFLPVLVRICRGNLKVWISVYKVAATSTGMGLRIYIIKKNRVSPHCNSY